MAATKLRIFMSTLLELFDDKFDTILRCQFRLMIGGDDAEFQGMPARRDAVQCPLLAFKHTHEFAVDVGVHVVAALALDQAKFQRHSVAGEYLLRRWRQDFYAGAFGGL